MFSINIFKKSKDEKNLKRVTSIKSLNNDHYNYGRKVASILLNHFEDEIRLDGIIDNCFKKNKDTTSSFERGYHSIFKDNEDYQHAQKFRNISPYNIGVDIFC